MANEMSEVVKQQLVGGENRGTDVRQAGQGRRVALCIAQQKT
jgi:hypothetical protein